MYRNVFLRRAGLVACAALLSACAASGPDAQRKADRFGEELTGGGSAGPGLASELERRDDLQTAAALYAVEAQNGATAQARGTALERLGAVLLRADRPRQAAGSFRAALRETPGSRSARVGLGIALLTGGEPQAAIDVLEGAATAGAVSALAPLGAAYSALGQHDRAIAVYDQGLARDPFNRNLLSNRALSAALSGDSARAYTDARSVADDPFATPTQQRNLSLVLAISGDPQQARNEGAALRLPSAEVERVIAVGSEIAQASGAQRDALVLALAGR